MTIGEARELIGSPIWPKVRDQFLATGEFTVYPKGDLRRLEYLDESVRQEIALWQEGLRNAAMWRTVVDGAKVRELKAKYPGVYPEAMRLAAYFERDFRSASGEEFPESALRRLMRMKFPEAYGLCFGDSTEQSRG